MGKAGHRKKKPFMDASADVSCPEMAIEDALSLQRALKLKNEGNRSFQCKNYSVAMEKYQQALKLTPSNHPDRALLHSNRAACLTQMKPVQYDSVIQECTLALDIQPQRHHTLLRRARAFEATGRLELALQDVKTLLQHTEGSHEDALAMAKRLHAALGIGQKDLQGKQNSSHAMSHTGTSWAALGASIVKDSSIVSPRSCPPTRPLPKKAAKPKPDPNPMPDGHAFTSCNHAARHSQASKPTVSARAVPRSKESLQKSPSHPSKAASFDLPSSRTSDMALPQEIGQRLMVDSLATPQNWCLKLIYDHDIRLAHLPIDCRFRDLRELVRKIFPWSKAVLIKYRDMEGDLVTITSTKELRLAEAARKLCQEAEPRPVGREPQSSTIDKPSVLTSADVWRLHVVEVPIEDEPMLGKDEDIKKDANKCGVTDDAEQGMTALNKVHLAKKAEKTDEGSWLCKTKEIELDDWLLEFAHLFKTYLGIDPLECVDIHDLGMEFCSEALEETVTSQEAQQLFELAVCKFREVVAVAFFNWGNVHMCAARKRITFDDENNKIDRLQAAFDWTKVQYMMAEKKYEDAIQVKPDFYEGILALGQQNFERAKLHWSLAVASKVDLSTWDSFETLGLFVTAGKKMLEAIEMWEKLKESRIKEAKACASVKRNPISGDSQGLRLDINEFNEAESLEEFVVMRSQINLSWGNIIFEHSQVEFRLGVPTWKQLLDAAVVKFELAGASPSDLRTVLKNHISNSSTFQDSTAENLKEHEHRLRSGLDEDAKEHVNGGDFKSGLRLIFGFCENEKT